MARKVPKVTPPEDLGDAPLISANLATGPRLDTQDLVNVATAARLEQKAVPGYLTTEFYFAALSALLAFILALVGKISFEVATGAITAAGVAYSVGRGIAKT